MPSSCESLPVSFRSPCINMPVPSSRYSLPSSTYRSSPYLSSSLERSYTPRTSARQAHSKTSSSYLSPSSCSSYSRKSSFSDDSAVSTLISNAHSLSVREKDEGRDDNTTKTRSDFSNYLSRRYSHTASATLAGLELYSKYMPSNYISSNTGKVSSAKPPLSQSDYSSSSYYIGKSVRSATSPILERASSSAGSRLAEKTYTTNTAIRGNTFSSLERQGSLKTRSSKPEVISNLNHTKKLNYNQSSCSSSEEDNSTEDNNGNGSQSYVVKVKHAVEDVEIRGAEAVSHQQLSVVHSFQNAQQSGEMTKRSSRKTQLSPVLPQKLNSSESTTSSSSSEKEEDEESDGGEEKNKTNRSMESGRLGQGSNETLHTRKSNMATLGITGTSAADNYSSLCSNRLIGQPFQSSISNKQHSVHGSPETAVMDGSYSIVRSSHQTHRSPNSGLVGLRNIGNTCFMNSVIQCLSNTKPLLEYLLGDYYLSDINATVSSMKGALIKAFSTVIQALWRPGSDERVVNTTSLKSQIQRFAPRFMGFNQQDAQEFLRYLLEGLHEDVNRVTKKPTPILTDIDEHLSDQQKAAESWKRYLRIDDSKIVDIFVGQLKSTLRCTSCGHSSVTFDPFWDLSLPIPARAGQVRLHQCFEVFTREEILDGDEKPTCSKCEMRQKCTKSLTIQKFPKILVIHLKRFSPVERFRGKLSISVDFPVNNLDLSAYAANKGESCTYHLYGVANHSGTSYSGHYTAYCKHPYSGEWHEYNDSRVYGISPRSVVTSEAYVLFYELA